MSKLMDILNTIMQFFLIGVFFIWKGITFTVRLVFEVLTSFDGM